ncbi:acyl carrier protein [Streptomyces cocklensis]|jgi:acyl carrier protein|uniref:Acyl carrier protein n=1 Tax=Actinacidiphila cocklensis TaxID=887465 RepID=A0A9W4DW25_9ACTN|nr:acyl carrier protein [Actinacidiphila cocklensis]MDD1062034.1 acyl carrier protein [Actinacidiphila cocklensis]WSX74775.1 acyl carrier protein [Streptomyces sp. NBC_00899]CAG6398700.1 Acyl carrier protein [Actinacidiphila cocklensis]
MSVIRPMLVELTGITEYADGVGDDVDLTASGIDSGDLVRLVLLIEQRTGVEITAEDMEGLATIADYEAFVAGRGAAGRSAADPVGGA